MTTKPLPTPAVVRSHLPGDAHSRSTAIGVTLFVIPFTLWIATLGCIVLVDPWWAKALLGVVNGMFIGIVFVVGHDAAHGSLTPSRWLNRLIGRLALFPSLHPYTSWTHTHNGLHHGFTNIKEKDPGFPPLSLAEYQALPAWRRFAERCYRTAWGLGPYYFAEMWLKWEILPSKSRSPRNSRMFQFDRLLVLVFAGAWVGSLIAAAIWRDESVWLLLLTGFAIPTIVWNYIISFVIYQHHTHPRIPWFRADDGPPYFRTQVQSTAHVMLPRAVDALFHQIMEHTAHHADPGVPLYRLPAAQRALEKSFRRDIVRILWTPAQFMKIFRVCRLYDYDGHRWLNYDGTPLTTSLFLQQSDRHGSAQNPLIAATPAAAAALEAVP